MTGKTHYKLGIMYYMIFSLLPLIATVPILSGNSKITLASVGVAALGALIPDSDTERSMINQINPITAGTKSIVSSIELIFKRILRLLIGISGGFLILNNLDSIERVFGQNDKTYIIAYTVAFTCIFAGITSEKFIQRIPIISTIYNICSVVVKSISTIIRRFIVLLIYLGAGFGLLVYNLKNYNEIMLYIAAAILLGTAIFPHRTFLHAVEGFVLYTLLAKYIAVRLGYHQLGTAFSIGYFSHIYLADILTNNGVPVSVIPTVFRKIGIHNRLMKFSLYRAAARILDAKLSISIMSTGTASGCVCEYIYCTILLLLAAALVASGQNTLTFALI